MEAGQAGCGLGPADFHVPVGEAKACWFCCVMNSLFRDCWKTSIGSVGPIGAKGLPQTRSSTTAMPCPTPMHRLTTA